MGTAVQGNLLCNDQIRSSGDKGFARTSMRDSSGHEYQAQTTAGKALLFGSCMFPFLHSHLFFWYPTILCSHF